MTDHLRLHHRNLRAPRARPGGRIIDRELIEDRVGVDAREAFHHVQRLAGSLEARLVGEVSGLDDKRLALPTAT